MVPLSDVVFPFLLGQKTDHLKCKVKKVHSSSCSWLREWWPITCEFSLMPTSLYSTGMFICMLRTTSFKVLSTVVNEDVGERG